jgi:addiction module HigA family antidote
MNKRPSDIILDYMAKHNISQEKLARSTYLNLQRIQDILADRCHITSDTASKLAHCFGNSQDFWINAQKSYNAQKSF